MNIYIEVENFYSGEKILITDVFAGEKKLINFWASWCSTCLKEHDMLMEISNNNDIKIIGVDYKDSRNNANKILNSLGNPFDDILFDENGSLGLDLGVYATPETFLVDENGIIIYKHIGEIDKNVWENEFLPLII